ncbi:MAG TPA: hypothetical protein VK446_02785, partial [Methylocystis sp.]|nr:hypothetical protein [Methylocystis sp.]
MNVVGNLARNIERAALGAIIVAAAVIAAGGANPLFAGFLGAAALRLLDAEPRDRRAQALYALGDFSAVALFAFLRNPAQVLWRAPASLPDVFVLSPIGAATATLLFLSGALLLRGRVAWTL